MKQISFVKSCCATLVLLVSIAARAQTIQGQADPSKTEYNTEDQTISKREIRQFIHYITRADIEEKNLLKLGVWPTSDNRARSSKPFLNAGLNVETTVERKISPAFSLMVGINYGVSYLRYDRILFSTPVTSITSSYDMQRTLALTLKLGSRYYYSMARKVREGKSANNFSGNYIGILAERYLLDRQRTTYYDLVTGESWLGRGDNLNTRPIFSVMWGFQRRLGRLGYVDINAGPAFVLPAAPQIMPPNSVFRQVPSGRSLSFQLNALIGLGW